MAAVSGTALRLVAAPGPSGEPTGPEMELAVCRHEIECFCHAITPSLQRLEVATYELGPAAHSEAIRCQRLVARLGRRSYG